MYERYTRVCWVVVITSTLRAWMHSKLKNLCTPVVERFIKALFTPNPEKISTTTVWERCICYAMSFQYRKSNKKKSTRTHFLQFFSCVGLTVEFAIFSVYMIGHICTYYRYIRIHLCCICGVFSICTYRCHVDMIYYYSFYFLIGYALYDIPKYNIKWHGWNEGGWTGGGHTHRK